MLQTNLKLSQSLRQIGMGLVTLGEAFEAIELAGTETPKVEKQTPQPATTTAKAKAKADKEAQTNNEVVNDPETGTPLETKAEEKPKAKTTKKKEEPKFDFEASNRDEKIEFLRSEMVKVSAQLKGDRTKVFAFLKKYNANKVNELSDDNLVDLHTDIQVFLAGPDALDI